MAHSHSRSAVNAGQCKDSLPSVNEILQRAESLPSALLDDLCGSESSQVVDLFVGGSGQGPLSNTPLTNRQRGNASSAIAGLDWLEWCSYGEWDRERWGEVRQVLEKAKERAKVGDGEAVVEIAGEVVAVQSAGARRGLYCSWVIVWAGIEIGVMDRAEESPTAFSVHVVARSLACMELGAGVFSHVHRFLARLGYAERRTVASRVDLACDLVGVTVVPFQEAFMSGGVVRRARHSALYFDGLRGSGVTIGKSSVMLRVYDKLLEAYKSGDAVKFACLLEKRWQGVERPEGGATRVEFQLKRDVLRAMGMDDVPKLLGNLREVSRWLTEDWCRFTDGVDCRKHTERVPSSSLWQQVQAALFHAFRCGEELPITWRRRLMGDPRRLVLQAAGCLSSALALTGKVAEAAEDASGAVLSLLESQLPWLGAWVREKRELLEAHSPIELLAAAVRPPSDAGRVRDAWLAFAGLPANFACSTEHKKQT